MTVPLWYKEITSGRKTANINTKNLRSFITVKAHFFNDTSKTAKITWFLLVLNWAMDVIVIGLYDFYYIHGPMEY